MPIAFNSKIKPAMPEHFTVQFSSRASMTARACVCLSPPPPLNRRCGRKCSDVIGPDSLSLHMLRNLAQAVFRFSGLTNIRVLLLL